MTCNALRHQNLSAEQIIIFHQQNLKNSSIHFMELFKIIL